MNVIILDRGEIALVRSRRACQEGFIYGETAAGSLPYSGVRLMTQFFCHFNVTLLAALLSLIQILFFFSQSISTLISGLCSPYTPEVLFLFPFSFGLSHRITLLKSDSVELSLWKTERLQKNK